MRDNHAKMDTKLKHNSVNMIAYMTRYKIP
jgi:hypothetical protein